MSRDSTFFCIFVLDQTAYLLVIFIKDSNMNVSKLLSLFPFNLLSYVYQILLLDFKPLFTYFVSFQSSLL